MKRRKKRQMLGSKCMFWSMAWMSTMHFDRRMNFPQYDSPKDQKRGKRSTLVCCCANMVQWVQVVSTTFTFASSSLAPASSAPIGLSWSVDSISLSQWSSPCTKYYRSLPYLIKWIIDSFLSFRHICKDFLHMCQHPVDSILRVIHFAITQSGVLPYPPHSRRSTKELAPSPSLNTVHHQESGYYRFIPQIGYGRRFGGSQHRQA